MPFFVMLVWSGCMQQGHDAVQGYHTRDQLYWSNLQRHVSAVLWVPQAMFAGRGQGRYIKHYVLTHCHNSLRFLCMRFTQIHSEKYLRRASPSLSSVFLKSPHRMFPSCRYEVFEFIEECRESNGKCLVHCHRGVSRSTAMCIAYLMYTLSPLFTEQQYFTPKIKLFC